MENGRIRLKLAAESKNNSCMLISWIKFGQICVGMTHTTNIRFHIDTIDIYFYSLAHKSVSSVIGLSVSTDNIKKNNCWKHTFQD